MTRPRCAAVLLLTALCGLWSCASAPSARDDASAHLARLAAADRPGDARAMQAPLPDALDANAFAPAPRDDDLARRSLADVVEEFASIPAADDPQAAAPTAESLLLYISGRSRRLAGDLGGAMNDLEAAAQADPSAAAPWREMGEAQRAMGDRLSAAAAYRQALRRDPSDPDSLVRLGLWSIDRRDAETAATLLARAVSIGRPGDPAFRHIAHFGLGRALLELGYLRAGVDASAIGLNLPDQLPAPSVFLDELESLFRQQGDAWRDVGDAALRLEDYDRALAAYDRAAALPTLDAAALSPRRVYAAMKTGNAARAAEVILGALERGDDPTGQRLLPLIRYVGRHSSIGPLLRQAIDQQRDGLSEDERAHRASLMARAAAAALHDDQAARALRQWLARHPSDVGAVRDLYRIVDADAPERLIDETVRLVDAAPLHEERYAAAMISFAPSPEKLLDVWPPASSAGSALLKARLLDHTGNISEAIQTLRPAAETSAAPSTVRALLVELLVQIGAYEEAQRVLDSIALDHDPRDRLVKARALAAIGRSADAMETLRPAIEETEGRPPALEGDPALFDAVMLASRLGVELAQPRVAETWSKRAIELDPRNEIPYARLIELYSSDGPLANDEALTRVVRELRTAAPSGRTLRWLRAQELAANSQYDQAERDLLSLAQEELTQPIVDLLTTIWFRTGSTDRAEEWLRDQLERRPNHPAPVRALARLLAQDDRAEQAVDLLRDWLARRPNDSSVARQLENVLRAELGRVEEADRLAFARLERMPPTLARAVEMADLLIRRDEEARAASDLLAAVSETQAIAPSLSRAFARVVFLLGQRAIEGDLDVQSALELHRIAFDRFPSLPIELTDSYLNLLARSDAPLEESLDVFDAAASNQPARAAELASVASQRLFALDRREDALRLVEHAGETIRAPSAQVLWDWLRMATVMLDEDSSIAALRTIARTGQAPLIYQNAVNDRPPRGDRANAELALIVASEFSRSIEFTSPEIESLYRLALEFDPDHAMANNNLGYLLTERGERLEEAERLIQKALSLRPNDPATTDSLGWVRYKQGVIADERDDAGRIVREGAVTILQRASGLGENRSDPIVIDHLGDALWALGDRQRAQGRWRTARALLEERIERARTAPNLEPDSDDVELLELISEKLRAAQRGEAPPIAEILGPINIPGEARENADARPDGV